MASESVLKSIENQSPKDITIPQNLKRKSPIIQDLLMFSKKEFDFKRVMPGQILEELLTITNPSSDNLQLKMQVVCEDSKFDELDEYVFTIRAAESGNYHHRHKTFFSPFSRAQFRVALKVPNTKTEQLLEGKIKMSLHILNKNQRDTENTKGDIENEYEDRESSVKFEFCIKSQIFIPKIIPSRSLVENGVEIIRLAMKKGKKCDIKIPFKNLDDISQCYQVELIKPSVEDKDEHLACINLVGTSGIITANGTIFVNVSTKISSLYRENLIKRVLVIKIRGSDVHLSYPLLLELY